VRALLDTFGCWLAPIVAGCREWSNTVLHETTSWKPDPGADSRD